MVPGTFDLGELFHCPLAVTIGQKRQTYVEAGHVLLGPVASGVQQLLVGDFTARVLPLSYIETAFVKGGGGPGTILAAGADGFVTQAEKAVNLVVYHVGANEIGTTSVLVGPALISGQRGFRPLGVCENEQVQKTPSWKEPHGVLHYLHLAEGFVVTLQVIEQFDQIETKWRVEPRQVCGSVQAADSILPALLIDGQLRAGDVGLGATFVACRAYTE